MANFSEDSFNSICYEFHSAALELSFTSETPQRLAETRNAFCGHDEARYQVTVFLGVSHGFLITRELIYWTCSSNSNWDFSKLNWALRMWRQIKIGRSIGNMIQIRYGGASAGTTWGVSGPLATVDVCQGAPPSKIYCYPAKINEMRLCMTKVFYSSPKVTFFFSSHLWIVSNAHWATSKVNHHKRRQL